MIQAVHKGKIVDINKHADNAVFLKQGITKDKQREYERRYNGSNGTYIIGGMYLGTHLDVKVFVYDDNQSYTFDVYEDIRRIKGIQRISAKLLTEIESHVGDKVNIVETTSGEYGFDVTQIL